MCTYNLNYNDYNANLCDGLQSILASSEMSDVTLAVEGQYFKAHQVILSMFSTYFQELFRVTPSRNTIFFMKNVKHRIMHNLLLFMYEGKAEIPSKDIQLFVDTASELKIKGLANGSDHKTTELPIEQDDVGQSLSQMINDIEQVTDITHSLKRPAEPLAPATKICKLTLDVPIQIPSDVTILPITSVQSDHLDAEDVENMLQPKEECIQVSDDGPIEIHNIDDETFESDDVDENNTMGMTIEKYEGDANEFWVAISNESSEHPLDGEQVTVTFCQAPNVCEVRGMIWDGFRYCIQQHNRVDGGHFTRWRCTGQSNRGCRAKVIISKKGHISLMHGHCHEKGRIYIKPETTVRTRTLTEIAREEFTRKYNSRTKYTKMLN